LSVTSTLIIGQDESPLPPQVPGVLVTNEGVNTAGVSGTTGYANINTIYADYNQNNTLPSQPAGVIVEGGNQTCAQGTIGYADINTIYAGYN